MSKARLFVNPLLMSISTLFKTILFQYGPHTISLQTECKPLPAAPCHQTSGIIYVCAGSAVQSECVDVVTLKTQLRLMH